MSWSSAHFCKKKLLWMLYSKMLLNVIYKYTDNSISSWSRWVIVISWSLLGSFLSKEHCLAQKLILSYALCPDLLSLFSLSIDPIFLFYPTRMTNTKKDEYLPNKKMNFWTMQDTKRVIEAWETLNYLLYQLFIPQSSLL